MRGNTARRVEVQAYHNATKSDGQVILEADFHFAQPGIKILAGHYTFIQDARIKQSPSWRHAKHFAHGFV